MSNFFCVILTLAALVIFDLIPPYRNGHITNFLRKKAENQFLKKNR